MADIGIQVGASIDALMHEFNIITHNIANVSTTGYKRTTNTFSRVLDAHTKGQELDYNSEVELDSALDFSQGGIDVTSRPLDFALYGKGFFVVETPEGPLYTRNGSLHVNQNGQIVNTEGFTIAGQSGPITIPANVALSQVSVSGDGNISAGNASIGKFKFVEFQDNESQLLPVGLGNFTAPEGVIPLEAGNLIVRQGYQESSNVKIVDELTDMIMVQRLYEANIKFLTAEAETSSTLMSVAMG